MISMDLASDSFVDQKGILRMLAYFIVLCLFLGYCLAVFWPSPLPLIVSSLEPASAPAGDGGGGTVKIFGSGFEDGMKVSFDDAEGTIDKTKSDSTSVTVTLPKHESGQSYLIVKNPTGQTVLIPKGFSFTEPSKAGTTQPGTPAAPAANEPAAGVPPTPAASKSATGAPPTPPADNKPSSAATAPPWPKVYRSPEGSYPTRVKFFWIPMEPPESVRFLIIVMVVGALGSLIHVFRSFYWYIGNRTLKSSWLLMYILLPFNGAGLAVLFYLIVRGGISGQAPINPGSLDGYAAIAALVGMFTQEAMAKLKQIAGAVFALPEVGKDPAITPPKISGIAPVSGLAAGGTQVTINGTGFAPGNIVSFGGVAATGVNVTSSTQLTATTPAHDAGVVDVEISNSVGQKSTLPKGFTYAAAAAPGGGPAVAAPTVSAIAPATGAMTGGTDVTITGTGFAAGDTVTLGGVAGTNINVTNDTQLTATTPAHAAGVVDVAVSDSNGQTATLPASFTFQ
jgi:hypothetical protein